MTPRSKQLSNRAAASPAHRGAASGFTLFEAAALVVIAVVLLAVLLPAARRARMGAALTQSLNNGRQITVAAQMYHFEHAGQVPYRGCRYQSGQLNGWDTWSAGGKNCDVFWQTSVGGLFDESAYTRSLNIYFINARIPRPLGYQNTGSGSTWTFNHGTPSAEQRSSLQIGVFQSPRDADTRERSWPNPTPGVSLYNDVGTSYVQNMKWWDDPALASLSFSARFEEGVRRIRLAFDGANPDFAWLGDQNLDYVPYFSTAQSPGQFGGVNTSVVGYVDGRVQYITLTPGAFSGPGYTLMP